MILGAVGFETPTAPGEADRAKWRTSLKLALPRADAPRHLARHGAKLMAHALVPRQRVPSAARRTRRSRRPSAQEPVRCRSRPAAARTGARGSPGLPTVTCTMEAHQCSCCAPAQCRHQRCRPRPPATRHQRSRWARSASTPCQCRPASRFFGHVGRWERVRWKLLIYWYRVGNSNFQTQSGPKRS